MIVPLVVYTDRGESESYARARISSILLEMDLSPPHQTKWKAVRSTREHMFVGFSGLPFKPTSRRGCFRHRYWRCCHYKVLVFSYARIAMILRLGSGKLTTMVLRHGEFVVVLLTLVVCVANCAKNDEGGVTEEAPGELRSLDLEVRKNEKNSINFPSSLLTKQTFYQKHLISSRRPIQRALWFRLNLG